MNNFVELGAKSLNDKIVWLDVSIQLTDRKWPYGFKNLAWTLDRYTALNFKTRKTFLSDYYPAKQNHKAIQIISPIAIDGKETTGYNSFTGG